nr:MMPL family transporter [Nocardioides sp. B-3]
MAFALHRAAPALFASAATVVPGMLCLLFAEMNSTAGLGPVAAIGIAVTVPGHGHPAARAAGHHRSLDLLAAPPRVRLPPSRRRPASGPRSADGSRPTRAACGWARA